jgi:dipeptidyl aminopeptidase/acylaminoacyl peptidase
MGGSYGGYSAVLAMTRDPGLFKAAIVEYGVMDIAYQMQNNPFSWRLHLDENEIDAPVRSFKSTNAKYLSRYPP